MADPKADNKSDNKPDNKADTADHVPAAILAGKFVKTWRRKVSVSEVAIETISVEPAQVERAIKAAASILNMPVITWDIADGFASQDLNLKNQIDELAEKYNDASAPKLTDPTAAMRFVSEVNIPGGSAAFIFHNFYQLMVSPITCQVFDNHMRHNLLARRDPTTKSPMIRPIHFIQCPYADLDLRGIRTIKHWITPLRFDMASEEELLAEQINSLVIELKHAEARNPARKGTSDYSDEYLRSLAAALRGVPRPRATSLLFYTASTFGGLTPDVPSALRAAAADLIAASTALEVVNPDDILPPEQLAGVGEISRAMVLAAGTYNASASDQHLDPAVGMTLVGVPGTGKSEISKTAAIIFGKATNRAFTVLRVKMGAIYGSLVGQTEANWEQIERCVEAFGPNTIVWLDEVDKAFGHVMESSGDSGVRQNLFGLILGWLSHPRRRCYVLATMNDRNGIPGEFFRRFDSMFFFDLPSHASRVAILKIHFAKRLIKTLSAKDKIAKKDPLDLLQFSDAQWTELGDMTDQFIPSEIESIVKESRNAAFADRGIAIPTFEELTALIEKTRGGIYAVQKAPDLKRLRDACKDARKAEIVDEGTNATSPLMGKGKKTKLSGRIMLDT